MESRKTCPKHAPEVQEHAVRMVFDHADGYPSQWAAIQSVAAEIDCAAQMPTSCSARIAMICSSEYQLFFMSSVP